VALPVFRSAIEPGAGLIPLLQCRLIRGIILQRRGNLGGGGIVLGLRLVQRRLCRCHFGRRFKVGP